MTGKLFINGVDAWTQWGVFLEYGSYDRLLSGENIKPYTENTSRSIDGKQVLIKNPRIEDRDVTLVFCFAQRTTPFLARLQSFKNTLINGKVIGGKIHPIDMFIPELEMTFRLIYQGSTTLSQGGLKIGKLGVRFNEPVPTNR